MKSVLQICYFLFRRKKRQIHQKRFGISAFKKNLLKTIESDRAVYQIVTADNLVNTNLTFRENFYRHRLRKTKICEISVSISTYNVELKQTYSYTMDQL